MRGSKRLIDIKTLKECKESIIHTMNKAIKRVSNEEGYDILESAFSDNISPDFLECYYKSPINEINTGLCCDKKQDSDDVLYVTIGKSRNLTKILVMWKNDSKVSSVSEGQIHSYENLFEVINKIIDKYKTQNIYLNIIDIDGLNVTKQKILELCPNISKEDSIFGNFITTNLQPCILLKQSISLITPTSCATKQVKDWIGDIFSEAFLLGNDMINNKPQVIEDEKRLCIVGI